MMMHRMKGHRSKGGGAMDMDFMDQYDFGELPADADVHMPDGENAEKVVADPNFFNSFGDLFDDDVMEMPKK
eukprot:CAMPEP_0196716858 /NCGR_PEP_ID=MMETSP1091-20130531/279_1 /TAXON_ID=302021 /ORGANISM="Rhodomonas sp., Strain CCMP768" /LENGTH=71 /DNA_ID=CAMNT_0042057021 /DNA_START=105 /DNA_END=320 /DNA_ORIENTATION=+